MKFKEIKNDVGRDSREIHQYAFNNLGKFQKFCTKNKIKKKYHNEFYVSRRKNKYMFIYILDELGYGVSFYNYYYNDKGINFIRVYYSNSDNYEELPSTIWVVHYNTHFWDRYKERMLLDSNLSIFDVVSKFNIETSILNFQEYDYILKEEGVISASLANNDGFSLGVLLKNDNMFIANTFVSLDMLKGSQIDEYIKSENQINEFDQLFKVIHKKVA